MIPKLVAKNTRLTPKVDRLRSRIVGAGAKELASYSHKSLPSSSSSGKKRKEDEPDDDNVKQIPKKKTRRVAKKILYSFIFFFFSKDLFSHLYNFLLSYDLFM